MFYSVEETVTKMTSTDWSTIASCVVCLYKYFVLFVVLLLLN